MIDDYVVFNIDKDVFHKMVLSKSMVPKSYRDLLSKNNLYLKPFHIVYKSTFLGEMEYRYYGKYWFKIVYVNNKRKLVYIGKDYQNEITVKLKLPFEGFSFMAYRSKKSPIFIKKRLLNIYADLLKNIVIDLTHS